MTVLGPLPDHVARALRGEPQDPQAAPREECAADSSAHLPPGGCEIDRDYTRERVDQATPEQLAAAMRLSSADHARALQAELREVGAVIVFVTQWEGFDQTLTIYGGDTDAVARVLDRHLFHRVVLGHMRGHVQCFVQGRRVRFSRPAPEYVDDDVRRAAGERTMSYGWVHDEITLSEHQLNDAMARVEANRAKIEQVIREHAGMVAFDLEGLDSIAKGIEKQWVLGIDPASGPFKLPCGLAFHGATGRHPTASTGLEPTRVTVAGGSVLDALGFTEQVTRSRCLDCNGSGVLAGFGFGASENACDRPCPCSPPKDEGPSEWTVVRREDVTSRYSASEAWEIDVRKRDRVRTYKLRANCMGTVVEDLADRRGVDYVVRVKGEHCVDMAIARLLCGLRDGSIVP